MLGLGSILGTGVFVSLGLAVGVAGQSAILALAIATGLAAMNALSSAQLAASYPVSGGTYAYGRKYLREEMGFVAGLAILLAKSASAAAAAIGLVSYAAAYAGWHALPVGAIAAGLVFFITGLVFAGVRRANIVNTILVGTTLIALVGLIISVASHGQFFPTSVQANSDSLHFPNLLEAAALLFVAFTGYGRIATLGEEVRRPRQTIPMAIITTILVTGLLYFGVLISGLVVLGEVGFAIEMQESSAPLQGIARALGAPTLLTLITLAAATAMAGVLLNLVLGLSRVAFAMGRDGELPKSLGRLDESGEPRRAVLAVGIFVALMALFGGLSMVWSFSAFAVLIYYAITNLCALQLSPEARLYPRIIPIVGLIGCLGLSLWIRPDAMLLGIVALSAGLILRWILKR